MAEMTGFCIKYQEAGGNVLVNSFDKDLGKGLHRGRSPCPPCNSTDKRENCRSRNIVYECRLIGEALRINYSKDVILNSKGEYMTNTISRLSIEEDAWERKERSRAEEE